MIRGSELLDLPIYDFKENKKKAYLKSFLLNLYTRKIEAIIINKNILLSNISYIPAYNIKKIYSDKVIAIIGENSLLYDKQTVDFLQYADYQQVINKTITGMDESILGIVRDIWINENNWEFLAYEISEGYLDDFMYGRKLMDSNQKYKLENNNVHLVNDLVVASYDNFSIH